MSDLIKREDAMKVAMWFGRSGQKYSHSFIKKRVMEIPSAERKGEWIWSPRDTDGTVSGCCSECSFTHLFVGGHTAQYKFCPNCGCRMKGADDE